MKYLFLALLSSSVVTSAFAAEEIAIENRVLAKINGKAITVMDVTKKMDMFLLRNNPEAFSLPEMRWKFYNASWREMFQDMYERELVLKAAEEQGVPASTGDVRQELEELFGPNVLVNLERAGLTYEEAFQMVRSEILIRRMLYFQVNAKVQASITPEEVQKAYEVYCSEGREKKEYEYIILLFKANDMQKAGVVAQDAYTALQEKKKTLEQIVTDYTTDEVSVVLSDMMTQNETKMARPILEIVSKMQKGGISEPKMQRARDGTPLMRIYSLYDVRDVVTELLPFTAMAETLKKEIANKRLAKETDVYFKKLRRDFAVNEEELSQIVASNIQPYAIQ